MLLGWEISIALQALFRVPCCIQARRKSFIAQKIVHLFLCECCSLHPLEEMCTESFTNRDHS